MDIPELPEEKAMRFKSEFSLSDYDVGVLVADKSIADYFEECIKLYNKPKVVANWIAGDIMAELNLKNVTIKELGILPDGLTGLLKMIDSGVINGKMAKEILLEAIETKHRPEDIVKEKGLSQISDAGQLEKVVKAILDKNQKSVNDYKGGKKNALTFLVGQIMKETKGKANPSMVNEILKKSLGE